MRTQHLRTISSVALLTLIVLASACGSSTSTVTSPTSVTRCAVTVTGKGDLPAQGGSGTINVSAARECSWTASTEGTWLSIKSAKSGQGDGAVEFTAVANPDPVTRRGAVVLNDQRVDVTQAAAECAISLAESSTTFSPAGGTGRLDVRASSALCKWAAQSDSSWIVLGPEAQGTGTALVPFQIMATTGPPRTGTISVAGQRFSVTQSEGCAYAITPVAYPAGAGGGSGTIAIATAAGCPWTARSNAGWVTLAQNEGSGPAAVSFSVAGTNGSARSGTAVIAGQTFTVTQSPACTVAISPDSASMPSGGGNGAVAVTAGAGCDWTASSNAPWILITSGATGSGNGSISFQVLETTVAARTGTLTVAGNTFTVVQQGAACSYTLSATTEVLPSEGGTATIGVTTAAACAWTAASNANWLSITSGASGSGSGSIAFAAAPLSGGGTRSGTLTVAGQTVTVTQSTACTFVISPEQVNIDAGGGTTAVSVAAPNGCAWTSSSTVPWITPKNGSESGNGNGNAQLIIAANTADARSGIVTIAGRTFTVNQAAAKVCSYTVKPLEQMVGRDDKVLKIEVRTTKECTWSAVSNAPWIKVAYGSSGSGDGDVWLYVEANSGPRRDGTLVIAGQTVTIKQKASD